MLEGLLTSSGFVMYSPPGTHPHNVAQAILHLSGGSDSLQAGWGCEPVPLTARDELSFYIHHFLPYGRQYVTIARRLRPDWGWDGEPYAQTFGLPPWNFSRGKLPEPPNWKT